MAFEFNTCKLSDGTEVKGLYEIQPKIFGDSRGYFLETYSERDFFAAGLTMKFVQDNQSKSSKGVLRGLHFQTQHPQGKLEALPTVFTFFPMKPYLPTNVPTSTTQKVRAASCGMWNCLESYST